MTKKVLLVGVGGVGAIAALGLEWRKQSEVTAVVRSDFDKAIKEGYHIKSVDYGEIKNFKPSHIVKSVKEAVNYGPFEFIVVCTKNTPDIVLIEEVIQDAVTDETAIVLLQNGIGIERPIIKRFPGTIVLSAVSIIGSSNHNCEINHDYIDKVSVGYFDNNVTSKEEQERVAKEFVELYSTENNDITFDPNVKYTRWKKLVYNGTLNPICALTGVDVARLEMFGGTNALVRQAMYEILSVARADGVELDKDICEIMIRSDDPLWYSPSMLIDMRKGNYTEVQVLCGNVVKIAEENGVPIPILKVIYDLHLVIQKSKMEKNGLIELPKERFIPDKEHPPL
ncbi:uncharacterized protein AC631_02547 [Debaryomyces fabryi]|uniref:2-dehydropantoate 2-reductase n=1 Tax=Debaryomyces fabryi TaxID=58627 RepID=A0A0V1PZN6_9ASCO|nr:uncharacterized protein AC631_02547 [Debaryomyces fabryi]KSA01673.1 hypothetical protein AC631_02547 [Debaryomyces fabryi]CUM55594.1 unnamed protein product [Debaryomyces fabryi]